ncbi:MAG: phospholipase [Chitinophagaceae bacterium]|nr:phospholipase [Chitinophagaceae bacterium]
MFQKQNKGTAYTTFNTIKLLRSGKPYFSTLLSMIEQAKYSIHLQVYIFDEDETGQQVADKLMEATKRGVNVYLMPDGYASKKLSAKFIQSLTDAGVNFSFFEPVLKSEHFYFGRRLHHKVTVVDGFYGLVAGLNISNRYNDMPDEPAWMDWGIYVEGQATQELYKICLEVWCKANKISNKPQHETIQEMVKDNCLVRVRRNDWVKRYNQISRSYVDMLRTSTSHVTIMSSYFIPGWFIRQRLARAARRGVKIRLILTGISDVKIAKGAECYIYRWFHKKNIDVYEYTAGVLHCKLSTQDGKFVTIGSYNVNNLSAYASVELNLDIANEAFAQSTDKQIDEIIEQHCILITPEIYKKRYNIIKTSMQFMSYLIVRMLINISTFYFKQQ